MMKHRSPLCVRTLQRRIVAPTALMMTAVVIVLLSFSVTAAEMPDAELDLPIESWPWGGKNKTKPNGKNHTSDSCSMHKTCRDCSSSGFSCHWCAHDQACHVKGSVFGCLEGVDCTDHNHTKPDNKQDKSCGSHKTCSECALSSSMCHWCAHDQACHEVGSIYGCVTGVDCFSNDRCRRTEPEPVDEMVFPEMGMGRILAVLVLSMICFCCATLGFCVAGGVKGAYDDLALIAGNPAPNQNNYRLASTEVSDTQAPEQETGNAVEGAQQQRENDIELTENGDDHCSLTCDAGDEEVTSPLLPQTRPPTSTAGSRHMRCLYNACTACYIVTVAVIGACTIGSIRFFPKRPEYNVCSDEVAWKSIVDSMTSMSVKPTFEILLSLLNPNHLDVSLDMGRGTFKHKDVYVGTFEIPPTTAKAMSISDLMIVATLAPDKWEALSLSTEYYRGKLVLEVDTQATIRIPGLFNYSFEADFDNIEVRVNEMSDRSLCACPEWKDARNHTL